MNFLSSRYIVIVTVMYIRDTEVETGQG